MTTELTSDMPEPTYFYTTHYPHRWSSGPSVLTLDDANYYKPIESLERARELAEKNRVDGYTEDRCVTTYGVMYTTEEKK